jgi:hypothetical protein
MPTKHDMGGVTLTVENLEIGVTSPGKVGTGTALSSAELAFLDGASTANTTASKAVIAGTGGNVAVAGDLTVDGAAGTGAASAGVISLTTPETTVVITDQLGRIDFSAPLEASGSDAVLKGASIWAEAGATFDATTNDTDLVFATGLSEAAAEKARLDSSGVFTVTGSITTTGGLTAESGTAVPASAGALAAGAPITMFSTGIKIWVTSDAPAFSATKGDLCINTAGSSSSTRLYINNGTTNWVAVTTAS